MIADEPAGGVTDLRQYLRILSRRRFVLIPTVMIVVGLTLVYSFLAKPVYSASSSVLIPELNPAAQLNNANQAGLSTPGLQRTLADQQQVAQGDQVRSAAWRSLGFKPSVSITTSATADILTFAARDQSKSRVVATATTFADSYINTSDMMLAAQYNQEIAAIQASLAQLQVPSSGSSSGSQNSVLSLTETLHQLQAASTLVSQTGPTIVHAAKVPTTPVSPKPLRNGILALVVGLILGIGLAYLVELLDDGINSRDDVERSSGGLPVVGMIPMVDAWRRKGGSHLAMVEDPTSLVSEAYRSLRTSLQFFSIDEPKEVVGLTSSLPDEGKTTTVANLAVSLARAGQRVVVVSCDLRRPKLHSFFGETNEVGLTSVLLEGSALGAALQAVPGEPHLRVLPTGPIPPNPTELLTLDRLREVVEALARISDVVLIDCPPVLPVSDALLLSRLVDGMLLLASAKTTSKRDLSRTTELLNQVNAPLLGTVLNRVPQGGGHGYGYGGYSYTYAAETTSRNGQTPSTRRASKRSRKLRAEAVVSKETTIRAAEGATESLTADGFPTDLDHALSDSVSHESADVDEFPEGHDSEASGVNGWRPAGQ